MAMKLSSLFVETYDPLSWDDGLMVNKNRINYISIGLMLVAFIIIGVALIDIPVTLPALIMLLIPFMIAGLTVEGKGWHILYPIIKHRQKVSTGSSMFCAPWFSPTKAEAHPVYREKLMDYLDYLRGGGEPSKTVEKHLHEWWTEADDLLKKREENKDKDIASMFVNTEQLEAYRKAKQDVDL